MQAPLVSDDELYRHQCEARYVCALSHGATNFLAGVEKQRGPDAATKLRDAAREQFKLGNRGEYNDWREPAHKGEK